MQTQRGPATPYLRALLLIVLSAALAASILVALPPDKSQAAGGWTTGILTNNSVHDAGPQLSSTHLVWAQKITTPYTWDIRLRDISTGATKTILTASLTHEGSWGGTLYPPYLSMAGDYVTVLDGSRSFSLYQISTGTNRLFASLSFDDPAIISVCTDGAYMIVTFDDGDRDIRAYDIAAAQWITVTDDSYDDRFPALDRGRIVWEQIRSPLTDSSILMYDLRTRTQTTIATRGAAPQISENWVGYQGSMVGGLSLYRLSDGLTIQASPSPPGGWMLTDDYALWNDMTIDGRKHLYALNLHTLQKTEVASDTAWKSLLAAEGDRLVYAVRPTAEYPLSDLMVADLDATPLQPYRLGQNVEIVKTWARPSGDVSLCGDLIAASASDGNDAEIVWGAWAEEELPEFTDVPSTYPYRDAIYGMRAAGAIDGFGDGTFGPDKLVIRQQFAKMIVLALGLPAVEADFPHLAVPFTDLGPDDPTQLYPHEYVAVCALAGITKGKTSTTFAPYDNITRAQVVTMVVRAADNLAVGTLSSVPSGWSGVLSYGDPTHGANIKKAEYNGLLAGIRASLSTPGLTGWDIYASATRGEVAQLLWNLMEKLD